MHRKNDILCGIALLVIGIWFAWQASSFPALAGMPYGAGLFPMIAAIGMSMCGALICLSSLLGRRVAATTEKKSERVDIGSRGLLHVCTLLVVVICYALFLEDLGFHVITFMALIVLFITLRVRFLNALILSISITIGVHFIFYSFLHVPLPWGIMERVAW